MIDTILSLFGIGYNYVSGVHQGKKLNALLDKLQKINLKVEKLSDHIFYSPSISEISHPKQQVISDLRDVRLNLQQLQNVTGGEIFSSTMVTTTEKIRKEFGKDPFDVLDFVRPYNRAKKHPNPSMTPIIFSDGSIKYIGWIMKGLLPSVFGIEFDKIYERKNNIYVPNNGLILKSNRVSDHFSFQKKAHSNFESSENEILRMLKNVISEKFGTGKVKITKDTNIREDLGFDSLDEVELIMEIEKELNIAIPDEDAAGFFTIRDALQYLISIK